ncbi:MAG TPA: FMN-binding glutamate synthase family protein [Firmicutes bacterium]|jgi:methylamine---glutamate N-methyltransferase subunit C|nr:FMN-binding glutamate synthase family protein [Bacillota bacterium]
MSAIVWICIGTIFGAGLAATSLIFISMYKFCHSISDFFKKSAFIEIMTLFYKLTWRNYFESNIRADTGKASKRPFGTNIHFLKWEQIQLNPIFLTRKPLACDIPVKTEVVIGPKAKKPLVLKVPILVGAMAYGNAISFKAKMALAKASVLTGTADNTGGGPLVEEARALADRYIIQFSKGFWSKSDEILKQADMIEISLGHGAYDSAPVRISGQKVTDGFAKRLGTIPGLDVVLESRLPGVENITDWRNLILRLKEVTGGVPIAAKFGGTHYIEQELDFMTQGGIDVIVLDGAEAGTHACPSILQDDVGLPTLPTLCRAVNYLKSRNLTKRISLLVGGGLFTPGDFLKCLALGADAVYFGTITALVMSHTQVTKATPWEPPTGIIYFGAKEEQKYNPDLGAKHIYNFFESCIQEMQQVARALGKPDLRDINKSDLVSLDPEYARMAGVQYLSR